MPSRNNLYFEENVVNLSPDDLLEEDELKERLMAGLKKKTKNKAILEWFDMEFHTIYEYGKWKGLEGLYKIARG